MRWSSPSPSEPSSPSPSTAISTSTIPSAPSPGSSNSSAASPAPKSVWSTPSTVSPTSSSSWSPARVTLRTTAICLLFGIRAETFNISSTTGIAGCMRARRLTLATGRLGSYSADRSPEFSAQAYAQGKQPPLVVATVMAAASLAAAIIYWAIDRRTPSTPRPTEAFLVSHLLHFGKADSFLLLLCVFYYAVILAFRGTFSIRYCQHAHGLSLTAAKTMNSYVFLIGIVATPSFGWLCHRLGRYAPMLTFGAFLLPVLIAIIAITNWSFWIATVLLGVSFSLVPAVMWPLASKLVAPPPFGSALGLMFVVQNAGIAGANLAADWLNDRNGATAQHPAGYQPVMLFFFGLSALSLACALLLWYTAGRRQKEVV